MLSADRRSVLTGAALSLALAPASVSSAARQSASPGGTTIEKLAWAGIRLERGNVALFIDAIAPDAEHGQPGPVLGTTKARSFALVTHHHGDHCDPVALKPVLGQSGYIVAEENVARLFDNRVDEVQPVRLYEPVFLSRGGGEFVAFAVPASDGFGHPQVSWVIDDGSHRFLHCGDTQWHGGFYDIGRAYGPFDVAFLPINGHRQHGGRYIEAPEPMSLTPERAAEAARILGAKAVVPIHFGSSGNPDYVEEPNALARFVAASAKAGIAARPLAPGEMMALT